MPPKIRQQAIQQVLGPELADHASASSRALYALLGGKIRGSVMRADGTYRGRRDVTVGDLERHFRGEISLAIVAAPDHEHSRFLAFDIDERARERIPIIGAILARRNLGNACFATEGSTSERGKVIVIFNAPRPATGLRSLAKAILEEARLQPSWGIENPRTIEVRPTRNEGGLLRIGGRHVYRQGPMERIFDPITGAERKLWTVAAARQGPRQNAAPTDPPHIAYVAEPFRASPLQKWVERLCNEGLSWPSNGTAGVRKTLTRLAHECHRLNGAGGIALFRETVERIKSASPDLAKPSPKNRDRRDVLEWERVAPIFHDAQKQRLAQHAEIDRIGVTLPRPDPASQGNVMYHEGMDGLRDTLEAFKRAIVGRGLNPTAFSLSYREIARDLGCSAMTAHRLVQSLVAAGALVIYHRGTQGERGLKTLFGFSHVADPGHHSVRARLRKVEEYEARKAADNADKIADLDARRSRRVSESSLPASPQAHGISAAQRATRAPVRRADATEPKATKMDEAEAGDLMDYLQRRIRPKPPNSA